MTFVTLFFLYLQYEIVKFGDRETLIWWRFFSLGYGLLLIALGIALIIVEFSSLDANSVVIWSLLSSNQKSYFKNSLSNLQAERTKNVALCGAFSIIVGALICGSMASQQYLYTSGQIRWKAPSMSRLPQLEQHEQVDFVYLCYRDEDELPGNTTE